MSHLPRRCRQYLERKKHDFSEAYEGGIAAVIIDGWVLPEGKYDHDSVSILLLIPDGYNDASPDMFHVFPWIRLQGQSTYPTGADVSCEYQGREWQRWSRHWTDWRSGIDGMAAWLTKVRHALDVAS